MDLQNHIWKNHLKCNENFTINFTVIFSAFAQIPQWRSGRLLLLCRKKGQARCLTTCHCRPNVATQPRRTNLLHCKDCSRLPRRLNTSPQRVKWHVSLAVSTHRQHNATPSLPTALSQSGSAAQNWKKIIKKVGGAGHRAVFSIISHTRRGDDRK